MWERLDLEMEHVFAFETCIYQDASHACTHTLLQGATMIAWCDMRHDISSLLLDTSSRHML
jgi:hypothetical protein